MANSFMKLKLRIRFFDKIATLNPFRFQRKTLN